MMNKKTLKSLKNDKRAVSPVIGVILMVAITVILAAVIAAFVFGFGAVEAAPQASLNLVEASETTDLVTIEHQGGDGIVYADARVLVTPDIGAPTIKTDGGILALSGTELGSAKVFEPGEHATQTTASTLVEGETCRVEIMHTPSGKLIFSGTVTVTA